MPAGETVCSTFRNVSLSQHVALMARRSMHALAPCLSACICTARAYACLTLNLLEFRFDFVLLQPASRIGHPRRAATPRRPQQPRSCSSRRQRPVATSLQLDVPPEVCRLLFMIQLYLISCTDQLYLNSYTDRL